MNFLSATNIKYMWNLGVNAKTSIFHSKFILENKQYNGLIFQNPKFWHYWNITSNYYKGTMSRVLEENLFCKLKILNQQTFKTIDLV